jgi:hypothetical protein
VNKYGVRNIGLPWHMVWATSCPNCGTINIVHDEKRDYDNFYFETTYDKSLLEVVTKIKSKDLGSIPEIKNRIINDRVEERFIQLYVKENPEVFGLENLKGPFPSGPDFKGVWKGKEVDIEVERTYTNYKKHQHHINWGFRKVEILICLDDKKPTNQAREGLPPNIWYIDQQHFLEWFTSYIEKDAQFKNLETVTEMIIEWFRDRLIEEEVGFENSFFKSPLEEYENDFHAISMQMALEFLSLFSERLKDIHFSYNEIDALKLLHFYLSQKDNYLEHEHKVLNY